MIYVGEMEKTIVNKSLYSDYFLLFTRGKPYLQGLVQNDKVGEQSMEFNKKKPTAYLELNVWTQKWTLHTQKDLPTTWICPNLFTWNPALLADRLTDTGENIENITFP